MPQKRNTHTPQRFRHNILPSEDDVPHRVEWKRQYLEALDLVTGELRRRFQQPGMIIAAKREQVSIYRSLHIIDMIISLWTVIKINKNTINYYKYTGLITL